MRKSYLTFFSLSSVYSVGSLIQKSISIFLIPLYTSYLLPEDYGIISIMTVSISIFSIFISSPINTGLGRYYYKPEYKEYNNILLFNLFLILLIQTIIICIFYYKFNSYITLLLFNQTSYFKIVKLYTIILFFEPIEGFLLYYIQLIKKAKYFIFVSLTKFIFTTGLIVLLIMKYKLGVYSIIWGNIFGLSYTSILCFIIFIRKTKIYISLSIIKAPLKYAYPQLLAGYSNIIIQSGDRYVLNYFNSLNDVGLYSFGYKIAGIINILIVEPVKKALLPIVYQKEKDPKEQKSFLKRITTHYYIISITIALALSLFSKEAVMLLAKKEIFWSSWIIVPVISFSFVQHGLGNFVGQGLAMKEKSFYISAIIVISALINIGLNFIFIPAFGFLGAAFATLISYIIWNSLKIYYSKKFYHLTFEVSRLVILTLVVTIVFLSATFIASTENILLNIVIKLIFIIFFILLLLITNLLKSDEKDFIIKTIKYIKKNGLKSSISLIYNKNENI